MHNQINWDYYYKYLKGIQDQFKTDLVNLVLNNFFPENSTYEFSNETGIISIRFDANILKPKDKRKLLYSKVGLKDAINECKYRNSPLCEDHLVILLSNYPPRFNFSINSEFDSPGNKKKRLDAILDEAAQKYDLRHYRGGYPYKSFYAQNKNGGWYKFRDIKGFKKTYPGHVFKPKYTKGMDFKRCLELPIAHNGA